MDELTSLSNCSSHTQPPHLAKSRTHTPHYSGDRSKLHTINIGVSDNDSTTSRSCSNTSRDIGDNINQNNQINNISDSDKYKDKHQK